MNLHLIPWALLILASVLFLAWRIVFFGRGVGLESNLHMKFGRLNHSRHCCRLVFPANVDLGQVTEQLFEDLVTFHRFGGNHNRIAVAYTKTGMHGETYVYFDTLFPMRW